MIVILSYLNEMSPMNYIYYYNPAKHFLQSKTKILDIHAGKENIRKDRG